MQKLKSTDKPLGLNRLFYLLGVFHKNTHYADSKGITLGEAIEEMHRDIDAMKADSLITTLDKTLQFCDQLEAMARVSRLPEWMQSNLLTLRPIILRGMLKGEAIDINAIRESWGHLKGNYLVLTRPNMEE